VKGYAQFPSPLKGSVYHSHQKEFKEINEFIRQREITQRKFKAYLSERKQEYGNRGIITNMDRDA
jgi:hypothetical protein